jgi:hypothetical protein
MTFYNNKMSWHFYNIYVVNNHAHVSILSKACVCVCMCESYLVKAVLRITFAWFVSKAQAYAHAHLHVHCTYVHVCVHWVLWLQEKSIRSCALTRAPYIRTCMCSLSTLITRQKHTLMRTYTCTVHTYMYVFTEYSDYKRKAYAHAHLHVHCTYVHVCVHWVLWLQGKNMRSCALTRALYIRTSMCSLSTLITREKIEL